MASAPELDMGKLQTFAFKVVGDVTAQQMGPLSTVGDRLGLFRTLAASGPVTSVEFAERAQINERYGREWLSAMACHGYLAYDDATKQFTLPPEHAFVLANTESPLYLTGLIKMAQPYWANIDLLGRGIQARRRRAAGSLRRAFLVRLRAVHLHLLPQQHGAGVAADNAHGGCPPARRRLRRRCRLRQRAGAHHPRAGIPRGDLRRLRQLRRPPSPRRTRTPRPRGWRIGCATRSAT